MLFKLTRHGICTQLLECHYRNRRNRRNRRTRRTPKPAIISHALSCEPLVIRQRDECDARIDQPDERGQRIERRLTIKTVETLTDQHVRHGDSTVFNTTDELSQPTLGQMVTGECRDRLVDNGFDDYETMFVRIPLGGLKLPPEAVTPCLGF